MRAQGLLDEPPAALDADHVCWADDGERPLSAVAERFLIGGLARGERLLCVGDDVVHGLRAKPGPLAAVDDLIARGVLEVLPTAAAYTGGSGFSADEQFAYYDVATARALADGYRGLRVVADVTPVAADPAARAELARWEHLADDFVASGSGMSALCIYRSDVLEPDVLAAMAAVHPLVHAPEDVVPFRVFFDDGGLVLAGCVDAFGADRLHAVLTSSPGSWGPVATLDLSGLEFVDAAGCRTLGHWVQENAERGVKTQFVDAPRLFRRIWQLVGCPEVAGTRPEGDEE